MVSVNLESSERSHFLRELKRKIYIKSKRISQKLVEMLKNVRDAKCSKMLKP